VGNGAYTIEAPQHYPLALSDNRALQWFSDQLVKARPDFLGAYLQLGATYLDLSQVKNATDILKKAIVVNEACADASALVGKAFELWGIREAACACYEEFLIFATEKHDPLEKERLRKKVTILKLTG
jgi:tetratricopeptide (TPR) repeat protein